ncbi:thioesterase-like superfamily domain-containing protein [Trichoderma barbatum]
MATYDVLMSFDQSGGAHEDRYTKNGPHVAPFERAVPGGYIMSLAILAASKSLKGNFQIHHLTAQFFSPGAKDKPLIFDVARTCEKKSIAARVVSVSQDGSLINVITMSFAQQPVVETPSMSYESQIPADISPPVDDGMNDLRWAYNGILHSLNLKRGMSSGNIVDNTTRQWLKMSHMPSDASVELHQSALVFLSDLYILDSPIRLLNLQLGLGEEEVGSTQEGSPYDRATTKNYSMVGDPRKGAPSDLKIITTLNHTIHFHNPSLVKAGDWIFMECSTSYAHGTRALTHSKLFSQDGKLLAVCTQEGFYRFNSKASPQKLKSSL